MSTATREPLLRVAGLSKTFGQNTVLADVALEVRAGEILAVVGHNGSGKSTLVKVLAGVHDPDAGSEIRVSGGPSRMHFIHQDLGLVGTLSAVENLGLSERRGWRAVTPVGRRAEKRQAERMLGRFGAKLDVTAPIARLSAAERAIVAIARALDGWRESGELLILDEPTAALDGGEVRLLFDTVRRLAAEGAGIVFISHRLDEVLNLADRVLALRDGRVVADVAGDEVDHDRLVRLIAGRDNLESAKPASTRLGDTPLLQARGIRGRGLASLDLDLHAGEIVGVSGNVGSGRDRIAALLFGASEIHGGHVWVEGKAIRLTSPDAAIQAGIGYVPSDRAVAAVMTLTARENMTLPGLRAFRGRFWRLRRRLERREVARWFADLDVQPPDAERPLHLFSGGNQQKVIAAKWLRLKPRVLLLDDPTVGVDVGAKATIHEFIRAAARSGTAILICSSDEKELATLADRVLVMRQSRVAADIPRGRLTEARLIREDFGVESNEAETTSVF